MVGPAPPYLIMARILVMMSGGVDSSVAAGLLRDEGHEVTGVTLRLADAPPGSGRVGGCCSLQDVEDARCVAHFLGIPHYSLNGKDLFQRTVLKNFAEDYHAGRTPNPCYRCNQWVKFEYILNWAEGLGFETVATGHYARIEEQAGRKMLRRAADRSKDQTYFLGSIRPEVLNKLRFPLGGLTKLEVRALAQRFGLITADKDESQELCFAHDLDYRSALSHGTPGDIVTLDGKVVAHHTGIEGFTIGQRKGIGLSGGPFYVVHLEPSTGRVTIGTEEDLLADTVELTEVNLFRPLQQSERLTAMPRYRHPGSDAIVDEVEMERLQIRFTLPERTITPGQVMALYEGEYLVASAIIEKAWLSGG